MKIEIGKKYNGTTYKCSYDSSEEWMFQNHRRNTHFHAGCKEGAFGIEANDSDNIFLIELDSLRDIVGVKEFDHRLTFLNIKDAIKEYENEKISEPPHNS